MSLINHKLLSALFFFFAVFIISDVAIAQDYVQSCYGYPEHPSCSISQCQPNLDVFDVQLGDPYDTTNGTFVQAIVSAGGEGYNMGGFFEIRLSILEKVTSGIGGAVVQGQKICTNDSVGWCGGCNDTTYIKIPLSENMYGLEFIAVAGGGGSSFDCACSASVIIPIGISATEVETTVPPCQAQIFDPIDARSGNVYYEQRDVSIGSWTGLPIVFTRSYNSSATVEPKSVLGPKWTHNFNYSISTAGDTVFMRTGTGQLLPFLSEMYPLGIGHTYEVDYDTVTERYSILEYSTARRFVFSDDGTLDSLYDREYGRLSFTYNSDTLLSRVTDAAGRYLTFHYNDNKKLDTLKFSNDSLAAAYEYSTVGDTLKKVTYSNGDWESYNYTSEYKAKGLLNEVETSDNTRLNFGYDALARGTFGAINDTMNVENIQYYMDSQGSNNFIHQTIATGSDTVTYESDFATDSSHRVLTKIYNGGCSNCASEYRYYGNYDLRAITHANERVDSMDYTQHGNMDKLWRDKGGSNERLTTNTFGGTYNNLLTSTIPSLHSITDAVTTYERNGNGDVLSLEISGSIDSSRTYEHTVDFDYDSYGRLEKIDRPRPNTDVYDTTGYHYHSNGDLQYINHANGTTTEYGELDYRGNLTWKVSLNCDTTRFEYDDYGRLNEVTIRAGEYCSLSTSFERNYAGDITKVTYPKGNYLEYSYYDNGLLEDIENQFGGRVHYEYDLYSRCSLEVYYDSLDTMFKYGRYLYTPRGQLEKIVFDDSTFYEFEYDEMGNRTLVVDANANSISYKYDNLNRLDTIWQYNGNVLYNTALEYDNNSNLSKVIDPDSNEYIYSYTDNGLLEYDSSGAKGATRYIYDPGGNLVAIKNAASDSIDFTYDEVNRLTRIAFPDSQNISYEYDGTQYSYGLGRLYKETTPACTTTYQFDRYGRLFIEYRITAGDTLSRNTLYQYDANSNLTAINFPSGYKCVYNYDNLDRVTTVAWTKSVGHYEFDTLVYNIKYDPFGDMTEWTLGNGIKVSQSHNLRYFIDEISTDTFNIMGRSYEFDSVGNITYIEDMLDSSNNIAISYDSLNQVRTAASSMFPDSLREYLYTKNGNRDTLVVDTGTAQQTIIYEYSDNRLTQIIDTDTTYWSYDDLGNVITIRAGTDSTTFQYNDNGQLVSVDDGSTAQYYYDGRGRRIKVVTGSSGRYIFYDPAGKIMSEFRTGTIKWDRDFIYLNGRIVARLEKHYDSGIESANAFLIIDDIGPIDLTPLPTDVDVFYYHTDHLGTPLVLTNEYGSIRWKARYYPFGELAYEWASAKNYIRMPGQWHDEETDLYYNWHRYYDPTTGRYLQPDPIGLAGGMNLYAYVGNNPTNAFDKNGMLFELIWDDPIERARHMNDTINYCDFLEHVEGRTLEEIIHEADELNNPRTVYNAEGPHGDFRYVIDPANPNQVIDMRHFLVVGPQGEFAGLFAEILQGPLGDLIYSDKGTVVDRTSYFDAQDFFSNNLGVIWYAQYYMFEPDLHQSLKKYFENRAGLNKKGIRRK
ncbi:MAG: RHS domain-containing protein [candidate division Zixibacteria bacterium]|nr:RHS domain-containing protein [candidate division Zixibacteria bacterium]